jgi:phosphoglycerol transferase
VNAHNNNTATRRIRWALAALGLFTLLFTVAGTWFLRKYLGPVTFDQVLYHLQHGGLDYTDPRMLNRALRYLGGTLLLTAVLLFVLRRLKGLGRSLLWGVLGCGAAARCPPGAAAAAEPLA